MTEQTDLLNAPIKQVTEHKEISEAKAEKLKNARKQKELKTIVKQRYGEFVPNGIDPLKVYRQWTNSIFGTNPVDDSVMYFILTTAKAAGIDVRIPRQMYAVPYNTFNKETQLWEKRYTVIVGIEGMVTIAENSKSYGGTTKPEYEFDEGENGKPDRDKIISCTIGVIKIVQGLQNISYQTVYFDEYYVENKNKKGEIISGLWQTKPKTMIKKVAHAHALRAAFTACAGMYIEEEVERRDVIDVDTKGNILTSTPDIQARIDGCKTIDELQTVLNSLNPEDKLRAQPFIDQKLGEL